MTKLRMIEAFAGIGSQIAAMKRLGIDVENVGISEIDKYAVQSYEAINGKVNNYGDITKVDKFDPTDLLIYSSPCQDFSQAGSQKGLVDENGNQTRSGLLLEVARLLLKYQECGELPKYLLMENVKALVSKKFKEKFELWLQALDLMGYNNYWKVLNAKDYGVPQNRERVFVVSIRKDIYKGTFSFPDKIVLKHRLKDLLEQNVDEKYYISDEKVAKFLEKRIEQNQQNVSTDDVIRTGNCLRPDKESGGSFAGATYNPEGYAPTLNTMEGGNRQPFVEFGDNQPTEPFCVASRGRNPNNPSDRTTGSPTEQRLEANTDFISNTITTVSKDAYVAEPNVLTPKRTEYGKAIRKEYEAGNIQESRHNMTEMQPRADGISNTITTVQKDNMLCEPKERFFKQAIETFEQNECDVGDTVDAFNKRINSSGCSPTLTTRPEGFKTAILPVVDDNQVIQQGAILSNYATKLEKITDIAGTLMARDYKGFGNQTTNGVIENDTAAKTPSLRIRKLTPKECWRLMGFTDEEHDAAAQAGVSASQRYKQAGNSIVVQCLCFIFWKLFQGTEYEPENGFKTDWLEELFK